MSGHIPEYKLADNEIVLVVEDHELLDVRMGHGIKFHLIKLKPNTYLKNLICHCDIQHCDHIHRRSWKESIQTENTEEETKKRRFAFEHKLNNPEPK